jgi:hypothetical protein
MRLRAAWMLMPETSVYLNDLAHSGKYEVGSSRETLHMEAIPKAHPMNQPPDNHFRSRILAADAPHIFGALAASNPVHRFRCPCYGKRLAAFAALTRDWSIRFWIFSPIT